MELPSGPTLLVPFNSSAELPAGPVIRLAIWIWTYSVQLKSTKEIYVSLLDCRLALIIYLFIYL